VGRFGTSPVDLVAAATFTLFLAWACRCDLRARRIPNNVVASLVLSGVGYALATMSPVAALEHALGGGALGLALWLPFWMVRMLGAGDVKLAAALGTWLGTAGVVEASLLGAVGGGVLAVWALARHGGLAAGATRFAGWMLASRITGRVAPELTPVERRIPYGLAIAAGGAAAAWIPGMLW
jgi:prepilin peptidase CpaA